MKAKAKSKNIPVNPKMPRTKWVALDFNYKIVAEGINIRSTANKASKITKDYSLMFVGLKGRKYIF